MEELREYLLDQDIWEREVDELLGNFNDNVTEDDLHIVAIFDSAYDLASYYIDNVIGELDRHIEAVLDYTELGNHIAESGDEYVTLSSGRIVEFKLQESRLMNYVKGNKYKMGHRWRYGSIK